MKRVSLIITVLFLLTAFCYGDMKDFGFKPLRNKIRYKEDYFRLYNQWLYPDQDSIGRNIFFLELAYVMPFDHPIKAIAPITNENQYEKYKHTLMMHICRMLTQEYINYGYIFMKEHVYFFNEEFKEDYLEGYDIADFYFGQAKRYWDQAIEYAEKARALKGYRTGLIAYEDEIMKIQSGELDYDKVIHSLKSRISRNRNEIARLWGTNN